MAVPLLDIGRQHEPVRDRLIGVFEEALRTSRFIKGPELEAFEAELADYCGASHAVGCASGTDALILALQAVGVGRGDTVITTPFTFFATAGAISRCGARPAFVDVLPDTYNMDPEQLSGYVAARCAMTDRGAVDRVTRSRIAAAIPVHLFGQPADMDGISSVCREWEIPVVEDACQAIGARWKDRRAGSLGDAAAFSFFPSKNLGALGDGGAVTTPSEEVAARVRSLREHGGSGYVHSMVGKNSRLDALQAGFLRVKLTMLDHWHEGRRANAEWYGRRLGELAEVRTPVIDPRARSVYNQYTLRAEDRDGLLGHLRAADIGCSVYYPVPLHLQECFRHLGYGEGDLPVAERACREVISIPVFGELTSGEREEVASAIESFYAG
jgi:dTDP-4-amino-4,6-dideoxygalactose transaminase